MIDSSYKVKFTPKAVDDLDSIYHYISHELKADIAADNLIEKIEESILRLKKFPFSCSIVNDEILKNKGYRKLVVKNYVVFYIVDENNKSLVIMRILYGAQKYEDVL